MYRVRVRRSKLLDYSLRTQKCVALSTSEAKKVALGDTVKKLVVVNIKILQFVARGAAPEITVVAINTGEKKPDSPRHRFGELEGLN